jgi:hypothetical protein
MRCSDYKLVNKMEDPYAVLGVREDAPMPVIEAAYKQLSKEYHPDSGSGNTEKFKEVQEAYNKLQQKSDSERVTDSSDTDSRVTSDKAEWEGWDVGDHTFGGMPTEESSGEGTPDQVEVDGKYMDVTLTGVERRDISDLISGRKIKELDSTEKLVISFDLYNKSGQRLKWNSGDMDVIDTEGYTYHSGLDIFIKEKELDPRWASNVVELESGTRSKFVTVMDEVPKDSKVTRIVHTLSVHEPGKVSGWVKEEERYVFDIESLSALPDAL